ncbi:PadR family transcriptional regulator [Glaciihabitans sp. INWT7]|uniref:PadR family transcriptional regulator n=1 Tax=Glaciihabitans sp. INWT7 TaxID=2596912 RepID=UPI001627C47C|nr:PadR family transcriptional regulator [Glaciihabitans sp. INWT7]QNE47336.1 PadR family transcriptional regulator [Glaciihabitans sp. INWT7]
MKRNHDIHNRNFRNSDHHPIRFNHESAGSGEGRGRGPGFGGFGGPGFGGPGFGSGFGGPGFGPRGPRRAGKGDVRSVILSLLAEGPSNGYGLIKAIADKTSGAWRPSPGSVYPTLQQLVDEDLIVSVGDGRKTEFELTDAGKTYVSEHADDFAKAWEATPGRSEQAGAFFESVGKLMGVAQQFRHSATDAQRAAAIEKLDEARRALYLILAD